MNPFRRDEDIAHLAEGLRLAGLEEGGASGPARAVVLNRPIANVFRREGALWTLAFDHEVAQMPERRGFSDIARLLAAPGEEVASTELAGEAIRSVGLEAIDEDARRAYRARLGEIEADLETAADNGDAARAGRLEEERDELIREIKQATGLGGLLRKAGDSGEKARTAVTWRIRSAIKNMQAVHPALARHLANSIRTGAFCSYRPEKAVEWRV